MLNVLCNDIKKLRTEGRKEEQTMLTLESLNLSVFIISRNFNLKPLSEVTSQSKFSSEPEQIRIT